MLRPVVLLQNAQTFQVKLVHFPDTVFGNWVGGSQDAREKPAGVRKTQVKRVPASAFLSKSKAGVFFRPYQLVRG
ncbi:hypothetical protein ABS71_14030 [bacterium SCN 62-11]|nr:MAG: hypothetical protein ABS71_14030 [bacterium SCN 62-11]